MVMMMAMMMLLMMMGDRARGGSKIKFSCWFTYSGLRGRPRRRGWIRLSAKALDVYVCLKGAFLQSVKLAGFFLAQAESWIFSRTSCSASWGRVRLRQPSARIESRWGGGASRRDRVCMLAMVNMRAQT